MKKSGFSFIELIISLVILSFILSAATIGLQSWMKTSRDVMRATDLSNYSNSLKQFFYKNETLISPFSGANIYVSGSANIIGYQGYMSSDIANMLGTEYKVDPLDKSMYTYSINSQQNQFELLTYFENKNDFLAYDYANKAYAGSVDFSQRIVGTNGYNVGIILDSSTKVPIQALLTGIDLASNNTSYTVHFLNSNSVSGTGQKILASITNYNKIIANMDTGLVFYTDMESVINTGGRVVLKDFSKYGNNATCYNVSTAVNCGGGVGPAFVNGIKGKGMKFNGTSNYINIINGSSLLNRTGGVFSLIFNTNVSVFSTATLMRIGVGCYTPGYNFGSIGVDGSMSVSNRNGVNGAGSISYSSYFSTLLGRNIRYNIIITGDGKNIRTYLNGTLIGTTATFSQAFAPINNMAFDIGANNGICGAYGTFFNGVMDEVRIYKRTFSDDDAKAFYLAK